MKPFALVGLAVSSLLLVVSAQNYGGQFIAQNKDFVGYNKWTLVDVVSGNSDNLKGAHLADNKDTTRTIYIKNNADRTDNGQFPIGTILVKTYSDKNKKILGGAAMVKRGGGYNKNYGGWEFFVLDNNAQKIAVNSQGRQTRGAIAMCNECHAKAAEDYVFTR